MPKVLSNIARHWSRNLGPVGTKLVLLPASMTAIVWPAPVPLIPPPKSIC